MINNRSILTAKSNGYKYIVAKCVEARQKNDYKQVDMSNIIKVDKSTICKFEHCYTKSLFILLWYIYLFGDDVFYKFDFNKIKGGDEIDSTANTQLNTKAN